MKKIVSMILAVGIAITNQLFIVPNDDDLLYSNFTANAAQYGKYFTYNTIDIDDDGQIDSVEITKCDQSAVSISIPSTMNGLPVVKIGSSAFRDCKNLESVVIPDTVTSIGNYSFQSCTYLESVTIGQSVASIGDWAFYKCENLKSVIIPNSVVTIGNRAFSDCNGLQNVSIGNNCANIGNYAFDNCYSLKEITIPENVFSIGIDAFNKCEVIYGYSGSEAQNYAEKNGINFVSIGGVVTTTTQDTVTTTVTTTTTSSVTTNKKVLYTEVYDRAPINEYSVDSIKVAADDQNYNYNDEKFKVDGVVTAKIVEHQNMREYVNYYWSDGSITKEVNTLFGPERIENKEFSLSELNPQFEYVSPAEVYIAFCPEMNEDVDVEIGLKCTFSLYDNKSCDGKISMHITAPKEPVVTSTPVTSTSLTTKVTSSTTTVTTTKHIISSDTEYGGTCISTGKMYVDAIDQNYNYNDKDYNVYGTTVIVPLYKDDWSKIIIFYWSDGSITSEVQEDFEYYKSLQFSFADLEPEYEYASPAEAYKALCPDMNKDIDADISFSCYIEELNQTCEGTIRMHFYAPEKIKGDVNLDGQFDDADLVLLQKWILAVPNTELKCWENADLSEDGQLDVFDLCLMKNELTSHL